MSIFDTIAAPIKRATKTAFDIISKPVKGVEKFLDAPDNSKLGTARNTIEAIAPEAGKFAKEVLQGTARSFASLGLSALGQKEIKPDTKLSKVLYGDEGVKNIQTRVKESGEKPTEVLESLGFSKDFSKKSGKLLGGLGVIGGTLLDVVPGVGGEAKVLKEIVAEGSEAIIKTIML